MSHSKGTTNYNLPLFTKDDRPAWLTDFNSAMQEVDTVVKGLSDKVNEGGLPTTGGTMDGNINMNEHALTNVQEVELPSAGNGLYVGAVVQPSGTTGARLTSVGDANAAAFVKPDTQDSYVPVRVGTPQTGDDAVNKNSLNGTLASYMKKSGATMTGALMLSGEPTEELQAATKKYVDDAVANVPTPTGGITQEQADARYVQLVGGTMTGALTLSGAPTSDLQAATKKYVDDKSSSPVFATEVAGSCNAAYIQNGMLYLSVNGSAYGNEKLAKFEGNPFNISTSMLQTIPAYNEETNTLTTATIEISYKNGVTTIMHMYDNKLYMFGLYIITF